MNRYKRSLVVAVILQCWAIAASAQPNISRDTTHYNDEELYSDDAMSSAPAYSWLGAGVLVGLHLPSLTDLNSSIAMPFIHQNLKEQAFMIGGQVFMPFPFVKNLRIGGIGMSGTSSVCCVPDSVQGQPVMRSLTYHFGYGALTFDYAIFNSNKVHVLLGSEFGLGSVELTAQQALNRQKFDITSEFSTTTFNITHTYHAPMFVIKPEAEFEYAPVRWLMLRLTAGYQISAMGTWVADDDVSLGDVGALAKVNANGPVVQFGVFLGFF
ncbi:MAG: hypothetical protein Q8916_06420 [Bacteroidota bacterium]|nr:hypothetical protein [Bacteroidota bacterium]MDP4230025.1 hypothetical protein [Bacteroidota bacterium]MDP4234834.1 hypothetical protein [Bacteroidota bacterium]